MSHPFINETEEKPKSIKEIDKELQNVDLLDRLNMIRAYFGTENINWNKKDCRKELMWIIDECWELRNKPWRLFNSLAELIEKFGNVKPGSQDYESIIILRKFASEAGKGKLHPIMSKIKKDVKFWNPQGEKDVRK
jgi:hypothetical protein